MRFPWMLVGLFLLTPGCAEEGSLPAASSGTGVSDLPMASWNETMEVRGNQASATAAGMALSMTSTEVLAWRPPNASGIKIEFRGNAATAGPLNRWHVEAVSEGKILAVTEEPGAGGTYNLDLGLQQYSSGALRVNYYPAENSATMSGDIIILTTVFYGPPDWGWSAFGV